MSTHEAEAVQAGGVKSLEKSTEIYTKRKDVIAIKERLLQLVPAEEYWSILNKFINGECSKVKYDEIIEKILLTNEMRILHNEFIRGIIYNAHFSTLPPPGISPPRSVPADIKPKVGNRAQKMKSVETFTAAEMGHIHSVEQLSSRLAVLLRASRVRVDHKALLYLHKQLKQYVVLLLQKAVDLTTKDYLTPSKMKISASHMSYVIRNYHHLTTGKFMF